jgi:hypothetical protein
MVYFHTKKSQFGNILEGLGTEKLSIFNVNLVYISVDGRLLQFEVFLYMYFTLFWYIYCKKKNLATLLACCTLRMDLELRQFPRYSILKQTLKMIFKKIYVPVLKHNLHDSA